ncbi:MAG: BTAD domain-containing putative transcriptional regulator [Gemmatimonadota bacterium]
MAVRVTTLGTLRIELDGRVLERLPAARNRSALLVYLAVEREATRDALMGLLWPDRPPARARHLLSQTLYELRQELGEGWIEAVGERLQATAELEADAVDMALAAESGDHDRAMALYGGSFLPGAALAVSRPMEGWIDAQQARLTRLHRRARREAIDARVAGDRLRDAVGLARSWAETDPLDDEAQHRLIELLAATGDRSGALRQYERYAALLAAELDLEPLDETRELVARIRSGEVGERAAAAVPAAPELREAGSGEPARGADRSPGAAPPADDGGGERGRFDLLLDRVAGLRYRRTFRWTLGYLAAAVLLLQGAQILTDAFLLPLVFLRVLALFLAAGAIGVLGAAWYVAEPRRRFGLPEAALTLLVGVFVFSLPPWFSNAESIPAFSDLDPNRIAVLYFDDMSADSSMAQLAAGFTEALIHELSQVDGLDVVSRRAVTPFRSNPELAYDSVVTTLRAGTLVEGSMTRIGDRLRLTIQLIDGATSSHLLSTTLESAADSVDELLVAMPEEAARLLRRKLGDWVRLQEMKTVASSAEALELVKRAEPLLVDARVVRWRDTESALPLLDRADSMLAEAARLDPEWPEPVMMRARVEEIRALATAAIPTYYAPGPTEKAFEHLHRVLDRWPDYAPAYAMRGNLRYTLAESGSVPEERLEELYEQAEADLRKAVLEDDGLADAWWGLSKVLMDQYSHAEARQAALRAVDNDAFLATDIENLFHLFFATFDAEDHPAAVDWCARLGQRYPRSSDHAFCELLLLTSSPLVSPDPDRAWDMAGIIVDSSAASAREVYEGYTAIQVGKVLVRAALPDSARAVVDRALPDGPVPDWGVYDLAHFNHMLGADDRALDLLEEWFDFNPVRARRLAKDWWFRRLREDPRFVRMVSQDEP